MQPLQASQAELKRSLQALDATASCGFWRRQKGWKDLLKDIDIAGMQARFYPVRNGGNYSQHIMICQGNCMLYKEKTRQEHCPSQQSYRTETLHSDRNNSQGNMGKLQPQKTLHRDISCPFRSTSVSTSNIGYYLVGGLGCAHHAHHPKVTNINYNVATINVALRRPSASSLNQQPWVVLTFC